MQSLKKRTEGFTIIEVMIVLVIAAVIILIVFLAVPALQRNSRNNQRKNDAARVLAATTEWRANNGNTMPTSAHAGAIQTNAGTLAYFSGVAVSAKGAAGYEDLSNSGTTSTWAGTTNVNVITNAKCENSSTKRAGNGVIVVYAVEKSDGTSQYICTG